MVRHDCPECGYETTGVLRDGEAQCAKCATPIESENVTSDPDNLTERDLDALAGGGSESLEAAVEEADDEDE